MRSLSAQGKEQLERLRTEINAAEAAVTPEQPCGRQSRRLANSSEAAIRLARINAGIQTYQQIYKEIHPLINEALIRNGYEPVGYIEGYFPHMNFDDPENLLEAAFRKMGFDFSAKELPMDLAGRTETFRPGKKWSRIAGSACCWPAVA